MKISGQRRGRIAAAVLAAGCVLAGRARAAAAAEGTGAERAAAVVARARAHLGSEDALRAVHTLHFTGTITLPDGREGPVDIIYKKPYQFRQEMVIDSQPPAAGSGVGEKGDPEASATSTEAAEVHQERHTTALDGYDGWRRVEEVGNPARWRLDLLNARQIEGLRINTWESIHFFGDIESVGGRMEYRGEQEVDGVLCDKVAFIHNERHSFLRYFDRATGELVLTEAGDSRTRENGEIVVGGIRFPRELVITEPSGTTAVRFDGVKINETFDDEVFRVPLLRPSGQPIPRESSEPPSENLPLSSEASELFQDPARGPSAAPASGPSSP